MKKQYITPSISVLAIELDGLMIAHSIEVLDYGKGDATEFYQPTIKKSDDTDFEAGAKKNDTWTVFDE